MNDVWRWWKYDARKSRGEKIVQVLLCTPHTPQALIINPIRASATTVLQPTARALSLTGRPQFTWKSLQIKQVYALRCSYGSCRARCYNNEINTVIGRNGANYNIFPPSGAASLVISDSFKKYWTFRSRHLQILAECKPQLQTTQRVTVTDSTKHHFCF
jgi:hypothetical protein